MSATNPLIEMATSLLAANGRDGQAALNFLVKIGKKHDVATEAIQYALDNTFSSIVEENSPSQETPASVAVAAPIEESSPFDGEEIATAVAVDEPPAVEPVADIYSSFPESMKSEPIWLVYKMVWNTKTGKNDKIPYNPLTGRKANDPTLGVTFDVVLTKVTEGLFDGVGIYVEPPYSVVDIDHCRDPLTGVIEPWAMDIIRELDTYAEASPSFTGVHVWLKGTKPGAACRKGIEIYSTKRFMTVTGIQIPGTPSTVNDRDITSVYSRMIAGKFNSTKIVESGASTNPQKTGVEIQKTGTVVTTKLEILMHGKITSTKPFVIDDGLGNSLTYESQSEADLSLATGLALKNANPVVIDKAFRESALYRDKWNDRQDYRDDTIKKAIQTAEKLRQAAETKTPTAGAAVAPTIPIVDDPSDNDTRFDMTGDTFNTKVYEDMAQRSTDYPNPGDQDWVSRVSRKYVHGTSIPLAYTREPLKAIILHAIDSKLIHPAFTKMSLRGNYFSLGESEGGKTTGLEFALEAGKTIMSISTIHPENLFRYKSETVFIRSFTPEGTIKRDANGTIKSGHAGWPSQFLYIKEGGLVAGCSEFFGAVFSQLTNLYDQTSAGTESMTNGDFSAGTVLASTVMCFTPSDFKMTFGGKGTIGGGGLNRWALSNPAEIHDYDDRDWERLSDAELGQDAGEMTARVNEIRQMKPTVLVEEPGAQLVRFETKQMLKKVGKVGKRLMDYFMREQVLQAAMAVDGSLVMTTKQAMYCRKWIEAQVACRLNSWPSDANNQIEGMEHAIRKAVDTHHVSETKLKDVCHFYREGSGGWFIYSTALKNVRASEAIKLTGKTRKGTRTYCPGSCSIHPVVEEEEKSKKPKKD